MFVTYIYFTVHLNFSQTSDLELLLTFQAYIDFEISEGEYERTRQLYDRLLDRTKHLKVWVSYAKFEASAPMEEEDEAEAQPKNDDEHKMECIQRCRGTSKSKYKSSFPVL